MPVKKEGAKHAVYNEAGKKTGEFLSEALAKKKDAGAKSLAEHKGKGKR
jgi:hypothetical protein